MVLQYGDKIRKQIVTELSERIARGELFSLTFDEWTSLKNRRFMNVNVHSYDNVFWNLGLVRIKGSIPAEKCITYLQNTLKEFSIAIENIISITTDGAAVMKKVGRLLDVNHQLCLAHGIQLSVIKVLYKRSVSDNISVENQEVAITEFEHGEDEEDDVMEDIGVFDVIEDTSTTDSSIQHESIGPIITKIRKIVVMFRRSPTKNDILQKHVKDEFKKELTLILDTKTRWSSMLVMLERIYEIKNCVRKSLIDIKSDIDLSENDLNVVSNIIMALQPVKVAAEALCSRDTNLYVADLTIRFMLDELSNQNNFLSNELKQDLIFRISERRTVYSDIYSYLHEPCPRIALNNENNYGVFNTTSKLVMEKNIVEIIQQFLKNDSETTEAEVVQVYETESTSESTVLSAVATSSQAMSMKEKLDLVI